MLFVGSLRLSLLLRPVCEVHRNLRTLTVSSRVLSFYNQRHYSSDNLANSLRDEATVSMEEKIVNVPPRMFSSFIKKFGMPRIQTDTDALWHKATVRLYYNCANKVDFVTFVRNYNLPDTLNSWFIITCLHMWLVLLRIRQDKDKVDSDTYEKFKVDIVEMLWADVTQRIDKISKHHVKVGTSQKRNLLTTYYSYLMTLMIELDEGILSDDVVLAGAVWRLFYKSQQTDDLIAVTELVRYIRMRVYELANRSFDDILNSKDDLWSMQFAEETSTEAGAP